MTRDKQKIIRDVFEEFKDEGMAYDKFGKLNDEENDIDWFRLKIKEEDSVEINQRIVISVLGQQFVAYGVKHRENVYTEEYLKEIKDRMY